MPRASIDQAIALSAIIAILNSDVPEDQLIANPQLLISEVQRRANFSWQEAADIAGVPKTKLYHWFRETFTRKEKQQLTFDDQAIVKQIVKEAIASSKELTVQYIKSELSEDYDNQIVYIAMQNARRARNIQRIEPLEMLPTYHVPLYKQNEANSGVADKIVEEYTPRTARSTVEDTKLNSFQILDFELSESSGVLELSLFN